MRSLMFGENEVRFRTAPISSAIASSALRKTSSVTGSIGGCGAEAIRGDVIHRRVSLPGGRGEGSRRR